MRWLAAHDGWSMPSDDGPDGPHAVAAIKIPGQSQPLLGMSPIRPGRYPLTDALCEAIEQLQQAVREGQRDRTGLRLVQSGQHS